MEKSIDLKIYAEVYKALQMLGNKYINKIPKKMYELICVQNEIYVKNVKNKSDLKLSSKSLDFLAVLHYRYWVDSEEEKKELFEIFQKNENESNKKLEEKNEYVFALGKNEDLIREDKLFLNESTIFETESNISLNESTVSKIENNILEEKNKNCPIVRSNEKWYKKIINTVKTFINNLKK